MDDKELLKEFGKTIRDYRIKKSISQEALSFECELDRTYIGSIERGERNVSLINIVKISKALNIHPSNLFKNIVFDEKS